MVGAASFQIYARVVRSTRANRFTCPLGSGAWDQVLCGSSRVQGVEFRVLGLRFRIEGSRLRASCLGFSCSGVRVFGSGRRIVRPTASVIKPGARPSLQFCSKTASSLCSMLDAVVDLRYPCVNMLRVFRFYPRMRSHFGEALT